MLLCLKLEERQIYIAVAKRLFRKLRAGGKIHLKLKATLNEPDINTQKLLFISIKI